MKKRSNLTNETLCIPKRVMQIITVLAITAILGRVVFVRTSLFYRYWPFQPKFGESLSTIDTVLISGEHFYLKVHDINVRVRYESTDYKVAYANNFGRVTAYQPGLAFIKVYAKDKTMTCRVRVIDLNTNGMNLRVGESRRLNVRGNLFFESYHSKNPSVANVSVFGKVTAVSKGSTEIVVKAKGRKMTCFVTVTD